MAGALCAAVLTGCRTTGADRGLWVDVGPSFLPQLGVAAGMGKTVRRGEGSELGLEVEGTVQFLDDADLVDDGTSSQGTWIEVRGGVKHTFRPGRRRRMVLRYGFVWFRQRGITGIIDDPGDYFGGYLGIGFEAEIRPGLTVGPELRAILAKGDGSLPWEFVPQIAFHVTWRF